MKTKIFLLLLFINSLAFSQVYVNTNATGTNNGTSWANAYTELATALTAVNTSTTVTEIWIAAGTYTPHANDRTVQFTVSKDNVSIYGGFNGTETVLSDRDMSLIHSTNETLLSGDLLGDDDTNITFDNTTRDDNSLRIVEIHGDAITLDGITIANGYANLTSGAVGRYGAGLLTDDSVGTFTVRNSVIRDNVAFFGAGIQVLTNINNSRITFDACIFDNNLSIRGAAFYVAPKSNRELFFTLSNSLLKNNKTADDPTKQRSGQGGAAGMMHAHYLSSKINATVVNNTFVHNENLGSDSNSDFPVLSVSKNYGTTNAGYTGFNFSNNIFWSNITSLGNTSKAIGKVFYSFVTPDIYNSIDEVGFSNIPTNKKHNTSNANPGFYDAGNENFTLLYSSPAINTGNTSKVPSNALKDLLYNNRVHNAIVDMGCYEFGSSTYIASLPRVYVDTDATGNNNGSSWADAYSSLEDALNNGIAETSEIWIAEGTYTPHATDYTKSFIFNIADLKVYGGFNGTEITLADRDLQTHHTILSGDLNGDDTGVAFSGNGRSENSYHVVQITANNILLDGLHVEDGNARGTGSRAFSAAVSILSTVSAVTFKNCEFNKNVSSSGGGVLKVGFTVDANFVIENCILNNNLSRFGSGIYVLTGAGGVTITLDITNTLFSNNESKDVDNSFQGYTGSAVWVRSEHNSSTLLTTITNSAFINNSDTGSQSATVSNGQIGPLALGRISTSTHTAVINNSIFYGNTDSSGNISKSINYGTTSYVSPHVNNAIGEDDFSNIPTGNKINTSNADPLFINSVGNDFKLQATSPAIDTGDNSFIPAGITTDLAGNARIYNTTVDMGCYEYDTTASVADEIQGRFTLYPNPVDTVLTIQLENTNFKSAEIYTLLGRKTLVSTTENINVSQLSKGIYLVKVTNTLGQISTKIFIKK